MTANQKMKAALRQYVVPELKSRGFAGSYPHFRRTYPDRVELLSFQWNKWGHSFLVEVSVVFTDRTGLAANFPSDSVAVLPDDLNTEHTNQRHRLAGNYNGWFCYTDVYRKSHLLSKPEYRFIGEPGYVPRFRERLVQKADEGIFRTVCEEVIRQMASAEQWWADMEKKKKSTL